MILNKKPLPGYLISFYFTATALAQMTATSSSEVGSIKNESPEFSSMATELGKYQHKLYLQIGTKWNQKVQTHMSEIGTNRVVVKFHVDPDGKAEDIKIIEGDSESKLAVISQAAIKEGVESCGPFSEKLRKEKPSGFDWQLAYRIY